MAVVCKDIIDYVESLAPVELAESWDNVGLLIGSRFTEIEKVLVCLDVTGKTINEAMGLKTDMIVSHHPVIFKGLKRVSNDNTRGSILYRLIQANTAVYCAHTNLDMADDGINSVLADAIGLSEVKDLKTVVTPGGKTAGLGKIGLLNESVSLDEFAELVKNRLGAYAVRVAGNLSKKVLKAAVFCGSFDDELDVLLSKEADVLIAGEIKYHTVLEALESGISVIEAGHFITENIIVEKLASMLSGRFPGIEVYCSKEKDPYSYI